jgi:enoyl-[acyl-carrier-protein] reductase (NADH)
MNPLQKNLEQLRAELAHLSPDDPTRKRLEQVIADLEQHLNNPQDADDKAKLDEGFRSALEHFEAEHPRLTLIVHQIINVLSGSGI